MTTILPNVFQNVQALTLFQLQLKIKQNLAVHTQNVGGRSIS